MKESKRKSKRKSNRKSKRKNQHQKVNKIPPESEPIVKTDLSQSSLSNFVNISISTLPPFPETAFDVLDAERKVELSQ